MYIVFDGMDGSGKGTQMELLKKEFGDSVVFTREPGGTPLAEDMRKIIRDNPRSSSSTPLFHFLAFWAAREETMHKLVIPAIQAGKHVFSDRGDSSTWAFQIWGEQQEHLIEEFVRLRSLLFLSPKRKAPDHYVIFDLPAGVARARVERDASREQNHFDVKDLSYYERVRKGFYDFRQRYPTIIIDAARSPEEIHQDVMKFMPKPKK